MKAQGFGRFVSRTDSLPVSVECAVTVALTSADSAARCVGVSAHSQKLRTFRKCPPLLPLMLSWCMSCFRQTPHRTTRTLACTPKPRDKKPTVVLIGNIDDIMITTSVGTIIRSGYSSKSSVRH